MNIALSLAALAAVVIAVTGFSRRFDLPAPLILVALGIGASFLPFIPEVHLTSEVVLVGLLPPLLYSAALQTSLVDFNHNRRPILLLSIGLVAFTTVGVAVVAYYLIPDIAWPAAFALGAVVAPPDAVAATAIARRIGLPRRIVTILEGESLLNDATALVALRTAIGAAGTVTVLGVGLRLPASRPVGGVAVGLLLYLVIGGVRRRVTDPVIDTSLSLVTPFVAYVAAEEIHGSGRARRGGRRAAARAQGADPADRDLPDRRAAELADHLVPAGERRLPADRPAGAVDPRGTSGRAAYPTVDVVKLCAATFARRGRAAAGVGVPGPLPAGAPGPRQGDRRPARLAAHHRARLGRHAGRGHAGRGVRDPARPSSTARR